MANEVVEEYRAKKKQGLVFKVDFEKAYDSVRWSCLDKILEKKALGIDRGSGLMVAYRRQIFQL